MLSFDTVHLLTDCLLDAERDAEKAGWNSPPTLLCLHRDPTTRADSSDATATSTEDAIHRTPVPLPGPLHLDTYHPSLTAVLAAMITAHHTAATEWTNARHTDSGDTHVLAWALLYLDNTDGSGPVRVVTAADVDGRRYHLTRRHGETHPIVDVSDDPDPQPSPTHSPLTALIQATAEPASTEPASSESPARLLSDPHPTAPALPRPDSSDPGNAPVAEADPDGRAALIRRLLRCWSTFHPHQPPPDELLTETVDAITTHIDAATADHAKQAADATRCATYNRTDLDRTRALFRAQIIGAIAEDNLDHELGAGILDACGLARPRRHYAVWITVPFQVQVTGVNDQDAADAAIDHLELTLRPDERIEADWSAHETGRVKAGEFEPDQD